MNDILDGICYGNHIVSGDANHWFNLVLERSVWVIISKFEHEFDLVLALLSSVRLTGNDEFLRVCFFESMELVKVYELQSFKLIILAANAFDLVHG